VHWASVWRPHWTRRPLPTVAARPGTSGARPPAALRLGSAFHEWKAAGTKETQSVCIRLGDDKPFAFARLWERWEGPDGPLESCCILTTAPNDLIAKIHNRMPMILDPKHFDQWLDPKEQDAASLAALLQPCPAEKMRAYAVSTWVNDVKHQDARCLEPAA
jgi:putative SOS response-associated peptidase YedK